ncbi:MAG: cytochrome c oxidase assembly protein [Limisphaerales bacterium]
MSPTSQAVLSSWSLDPKIALGVVASIVLYLRGWLILHRTSPTRFPAWRLFAFIGGLATLWMAIASPLDAFSGFLLSAHMVQHLLLLSVAPPLILLGSPLLPLLRGLPRAFARDGVGPFLVWPALRRVANAITLPLNCWIVMALTLCAWHVPAAFELALRSPAWHKVEHGCFFGAALLFWWPVVRPFPSRPQWPLWSVPVYLLAADLLNTALSAIFTFSDHVLYPWYLEAPRLLGTTALGDQSCAGVIMWVPGSLVFLIPAALIAIEYLSPAHLLVRPQRANHGSNSGSRGAPARGRALASVARCRRSGPRPAVHRGGFDLLSVPVVGPFLRARSSRRIMQAALFIIAIAVIVDGLFGPQVSPTNLAGVWPWTYWRAFVVIALLAAGNLFCMACPFMLFRELGRRLGFRQRAWPRALRSKWFGIALLILFFWGYEFFGLWDKPIWTAWLIINYFLAAFAIDALFRGASFCKYVCPIGQYQFIASLVSPLEVKVRQPDVCASCRTHDCLRGNERQRGCEMDLYLPRKSGNLDCTFCLDCVRACPHDNIGVLAVAPGMDVVRDPQRSSVGRLSRRSDIAALALVFVFAAFANAAFMTAPVVAFSSNLAAGFGLISSKPVTAVLLVMALVLAPATVALAAAYASRAASGVSIAARELLCRFSLSLVPLGAAMWAGHFLFHLFVGWGSGWTTFRRAANSLGWPLVKLSEREFSSSPLGADAVRVLQTILLDAGFLLALYLAWRICLVYAPRARDALSLFAAWAGLATILYAAGVWIILQPMEMRGLAGTILPP